VLLSSCALAQSNSGFDVSGNLSFNGNSSPAVAGLPTKQVNAFGWQTSGDSHLNRWLSVTSEFGYASADAGDLFGLTSPGSASIHHYSLLGGPRITLPLRGRISPFFEGLAGWDRATTKINSNGISAVGTDMQTAYAFGGGAQIRLNRRISFRVQADYFGTEHSTTFLGWEPAHLRVAGGVVIRLVGPRDPRQLAIKRTPEPAPSPDVAPASTEAKVVETIKPVQEPAIVASVPQSSVVEQPQIQPQPIVQWQPVPSTPAQTTQQQAAISAPATGVQKPANPPAVIAGVVIVPSPTKPIPQTQVNPQTVTPTPVTSSAPTYVASAAPVQQAQAEAEPQSLGEYARRIRAKKQQQQ
jgi:hypothetical protein